MLEFSVVFGREIQKAVQRVRVLSSPLFPVCNVRPIMRGFTRQVPLPEAVITRDMSRAAIDTT